MGLMLAEPEFHTRCFVEWEKYPRSTLIAAMRAGYFTQAPIWDDVTTLDARPFAGAFDTLLAGYPCQPFSTAGQRKGETDDRHLWPDIERIIGELGDGLRWCFFENVAGHLTLGLDAVLRALHRLGFRTAVGVFSAEEVGAPHERQRVFIVAYRDSGKRGADERAANAWADGRDDAGGCGGIELADASEPGPQGQQRGQRDARERQDTNGLAGPSSGTGLFPPGPTDTARWLGTIDRAGYMAPALSLREVIAWAGRCEAAGIKWETTPESMVCRMADGLAQRSRALRLLGNGVVPLQAAHAWRALSAALGLWPVDLDGAGGTAGAGAGEFVLMDAAE